MSVSAISASTASGKGCGAKADKVTDKVTHKGRRRTQRVHGVEKAREATTRYRQAKGATRVRKAGCKETHAAGIQG